MEPAVGSLQPKSGLLARFVVSESGKVIDDRRHAPHNWLLDLEIEKLVPTLTNEIHGDFVTPVAKNRRDPLNG